MILLISIITLFYILLVLGFIIYWEKIPSNVQEKSSEKKTRISVIVAVRNEEKNIQYLLEDLNQQDYPFQNFEVIITDDFSTDTTHSIIENFVSVAHYQLRLFTLPESFQHSSNKKECIRKGVENSQGDLIITTDGDCRVSSGWLSAFEYAYVRSQSKMITGPVTFFTSNSIFNQMQTIEFASLIGSGAASLQAGFPNMCNGACLAYEKKAFYEVKGFSGNEKIPSGDDEFLMHKMYKRYPGKVMFLKDADALVKTSSKHTLRDFKEQRRRWAGKWGYYQLKSIRFLAFFIFLYNLSLLTSFVLMLAEIFPPVLFWEQILIKIVIEFVFLKRVLGLFNKKIQFIPFLLLQLIYPFYVVFFGLTSISGKYEWKGRKINP